jgi:DNA polymerase elongation subunit (family B)
VKILLLDIETSPNLAYVWGLFKQNVAINQIKESGSVLCWAAKWYGSRDVMFDSVHKSSEIAMLDKLHRLVSEADCIVHYNGKRFDIPCLNREWLRHGFKPPSPHKDIDLLETAKRRFRFVSNKLDYVSQYLGLGAKAQHSGFDLWVGCMAREPKSWAMMEKYNRQDVVLLEKLYTKLLPWIDRHPSHQIEKEEMGCPKCGSDQYQQRGFACTASHKYRRYQCSSCGGWFRGHRTVLRPSKERPVNVAA